MFRRTKSQNETTASGATAVSQDGTPASGKGRPTPTRKEAEAAARARAKAALDPKATRRQQRDQRAARSQEVRAGLKSGDERYLPARDKGPVRRFIRDFVDSRFSFI